MNSFPTRRAFAGLIGAAGVMAGAARAAPAVRRFTVASPDGHLRVVVEAGRREGLRWQISADGVPVITPSGLGLRTASGIQLGRDVLVLGATRKAHKGAWQPLFGSASSYDETSNELTVHLLQHGIAFDIIVRVFDGAAALRYRLVSCGAASLAMAGETTRYRFPKTARLYASRDEGEIEVSAQGRLAPAPWPDLTVSSDRGDYADLPITVDIGNGLFAFMAESDRIHYPRAMIRSAGDGLATFLMHYPARATGWGGQDITPEAAEFTLDAGQATPWRIVMVAKSAPGLIELSGIIPTLARPNVLGDVSWARPGRAIRVRKYTTEHTLQVIDFAAKHRMEYVEFDAHWYGDGTDAGDASVPIPQLDMARIVAYGRERKVGIILYLDRVAVSRDRDRLLKIYRDWGIAGLKLGFMWEGRQADVDFIYDTVKACGEHRLIVNLHDDLRPAGLERTLPNYMALEGVRGNEQFPPARHNVNLAFTRSIAGPVDYTICYATERNQTTNAHQLAMAAIYYNPLTFLYWYDQPEKYADKPWPELAWFDQCPTTWDETRAVAGELGEYVGVARRQGRRWFLGVLTNELSRRLDLDLSFLGGGRWTATRYGDGERTSPAWKTPVTIATETVTAKDRFHVVLNPAGGQAVLFDPME